jgi:hypothetical protein
MLKRHEVEILLKAGHSKAEVARLAGVSLRSVNRIAEEAPVVHVDDVAEPEKHQMKIKLFPLGGWLCQPVGRDSRGWKYSFLS